MCGIIAYMAKEGAKNSEAAAQETAINQYEEQCARGQRGFGIISIEKNKAIIRRATEPVKFMFDLRDAKSKFLMIHHRIPTSTENKLNQTHPIAVPMPRRGTLFVMHNGIINNARELFRKHTDELGYVYTTYKKADTDAYLYREFNDSESFAIELSRFITGEIKTIGARGSAAFLALLVDKDMKPISFHYGRNNENPLVVEEVDGGILIASEAKGENIAPFELNTRVYNGNKFGPLTRITMPFAPPLAPVYPARDVGFGANYTWSSTKAGATAKNPPSAYDPTKKDVRVMEERASRVSAFADDPNGAAAIQYEEMAEEETTIKMEMVSEVINDIALTFSLGQLVKKDITAALKEIANILTPLIERQRDIEEAAIRSTGEDPSVIKWINEETDKNLPHETHFLLG